MAMLHVIRHALDHGNTTNALRNGVGYGGSRPWERGLDPRVSPRGCVPGAQTTLPRPKPTPN